MSELNGKHKKWAIVVPAEWTARDIREKLGHKLLNIKLMKRGMTEAELNEAAKGLADRHI